MTFLLLSVPLVPLAAGMAALFLPRKARGASGMLVVAASAWSLLALLLMQGEQVTVQANWFESARYAVSVGLTLNGLTWFAALLVSSVALAVTLYSIGYMAEEKRRARFFAELGFFIGAMLALVLASSLMLLYVAWEAVGLASYLLIGFHFEEQPARAGAAKAFLLTRIGDVAFLIGWLLVFMQLGTLDIAALLQASEAGTLPASLVPLLALLFFAAAVGKSAQLPLSMWLPGAMAAPTPVSALLHSATMVAAGAYLLLRLYPLFAATPAVLDVVLWTGFITAAVAALVASAQMDLKRVLAWSTISQLGEMMFALGLGAPLAAAMHLVAHACFKATLFMAAGNIDHYAGSRDLREVGGMWRVLPVTAACFAVAALAVAGIQPFFMESSHDAIFRAALRTGWMPAAGVLALVFLGGVYIGRAGIAVLAGATRTPRADSGKVRLSMQVAIIALAAATALITLIITALPAILPFEALPHSSGSERIVALLVGLAGLAIGGGRALRQGAVPALGAFPVTWEKGFEKMLALPLHLIQAIARAVARIEHWLDRAAVGMVAAVLFIAGGGTKRGGGLLAGERFLDAGGQALALFSVQWAQATERSERNGFHAGGDKLARWLQAGGAQLHALQAGKLYLYTLGLFIWALAVVIVAGLLFFR